MVAVIVIEPHALLRLGILQHLAEVLPTSRLEGTDYSFLGQESSAEHENDLVLLSVPASEDVIALVEAAQRVYASKQILLLSDPTAMPTSWQNLPPVVAGYVPRSTSPDVLAASIRLVLVGGKCFQLSSPAIATNGRQADRGHPSFGSSPTMGQTKTLLSAISHDVNTSPVAPNTKKTPSALTANEAQMLNITPRQYEVLVLLARGYPIKTVSRHLNISVATAKAHTETLYQRLDAHNRNEAVYTAVSRGATLGWHQLDSQTVEEQPKKNAATP